MRKLTAGSCSLSWRTHSTPLTPGSCMSMMTTSGRTPGMPRSADGPSSNAPASLQFSASSINCANWLRMFSSSSTTATLTFFVIFIFPNLNLLHSGQGPSFPQGHEYALRACRLAGLPVNSQTDGHALAGLGLDQELAAQPLDALAHIGQSVAQAAGLHGGQVKARAVVLHQEFHLLADDFGPQENLRRAGMFEGIVESFLDGQEDIVPHVRQQRHLGEVVRDLK